MRDSVIVQHAEPFTRPGSPYNFGANNQYCNYRRLTQTSRSADATHTF